MSVMRTREPGEIFGPRMTLFADVLSVGLATAVACLPLVTAPAALSSACAVLRGAGKGQPATAGRYFAVLRRRLRAGDLAAGAVALAGALLFAADLALAGAGPDGRVAVSWRCGMHRRLATGMAASTLALITVVGTAAAAGATPADKPQVLANWTRPARPATTPGPPPVPTSPRGVRTRSTGPRTTAPPRRTTVPRD